MHPKIRLLTSALTLLAGLLCSMVTHAQKQAQKMDSALSDKFAITVTNDSLSVTYKGLPLPIKNTRDLGNYLKENKQNISEKDLTLTSFSNTDREKVNAVSDLLKENGMTHYPRMEWLYFPPPKPTKTARSTPDAFDH